MTAERFSDFGSLYALENQNWKKIGSGTVTLITNVHKPSHVIIRIDGNDIDTNIGPVFQCKPKTKPKGNKSYILKGNNTKSNQEYILATRFKSIDTANSFRLGVENAFNLWKDSEKNANGARSPRRKKNGHNDYHARTVTLAPDEIRKKLAKKAWRCKLCTADNIAAAMKCKVCFSPRLIQLKKLSSAEELSEVDSVSVQSFSNDDHKSPRASPGLIKMPELDPNTASIGAIYGDLNIPVSPATSNVSFDWGSAEANDKLSKEPNPDHQDIDTTKQDFIRILTTIESNITHQDPLKLFEDLAKVAKRLMRKDNKYRTLDLKNPVVQERLMKIGGVDGYLEYLGFEEAEHQKLVCPDDQPPRSVIKTAQEVCREFLAEWKKKQHIFDLLSQSKKDILGTTTITETTNKNDINDQKEEENKPNDANNKNEDEYTLRQLVWSITHESSRDENQTSDVLLLCHGVFAESKDLLALLIERFHGKTDISGDDNNNAVDNKNRKNLLWNTQVKVGSMLSSWMKTFWEQDFENQPQLMDDMEAFFESLDNVTDKRVRVLLKKMRGIFDMQYNKYQEILNKKQHQNHKHKDILNQFGKPKNFNIADQKATTLAEQFTLMHFKTFKNIAKRELLGQSWKKKDGRAPNVLQMIKLFNETAKWVQILILTQPNLKKRAKVIRLCIGVMMHMKAFRNFSGCCAFHSALQSTPVHRLKTCWSMINSSDMKKVEEIKKIFGYSTGGHFTELRKLHRSAHSPAILHTGLFLQDLLGIDEGLDSHTKSGKVNFKKLLKLHEKIDTISMYQLEEYHFDENHIIQSVILQDFKAQEQIDDDFLFKISCSVKASDQKKK